MEVIDTTSADLDMECTRCGAEWYATRPPPRDPADDEAYEFKMKNYWQLCARCGGAAKSKQESK